MNKENLLRMVEFLKTIPEEKFEMSCYRLSETTGMANENAVSTECNTAGCALGWCTVLDPKGVEKHRVYNSELFAEGEIEFADWSEDFTGLNMHSTEWHWCFGVTWAKYDNTPLGAAERIMFLLTYGVPDRFIKDDYDSYDLVSLYKDIQL